MYESIYKNNELENEVSLDMSYFWYSEGGRSSNEDKDSVIEDDTEDIMEELGKSLKGAK
jgi:hypothetical protein